MRKLAKRLTVFSLSAALAIINVLCCTLVSAGEDVIDGGTDGTTWIDGDGNDITTTGKSVPVTLTTVRNDRYEVTLDWGDFKLYYDYGTWDSATGSYQGGSWSTESFDGNNNMVTATSRSSAPLNVSMAYQDLANADQVVKDLDLSMYTQPKGGTLVDGVDQKLEKTGDSVTEYLYTDNVLPDSSASTLYTDMQIGNIVVKISKA